MYATARFIATVNWRHINRRNAILGELIFAKSFRNVLVSTFDCYSYFHFFHFHLNLIWECVHFDFDFSFIQSWPFFLFSDVVDVTRSSHHWCCWSIIKKSSNIGAMTMMMIDHHAVGEIVMITRIRIHLPARLKAKILNDCCKFWHWITQ